MKLKRGWVMVMWEKKCLSKGTTFDTRNSTWRRIWLQLDHAHSFFNFLVFPLHCDNLVDHTHLWQCNASLCSKISTFRWFYDKNHAIKKFPGLNSPLSNHLSIWYVIFTSFLVKCWWIFLSIGHYSSNILEICLTRTFQHGQNWPFRVFYINHGIKWPLYFIP